MQIRDAVRADVEAINRLSGDMGYDVVSHAAAEKRIAALLQSADDRLWVAEDAGVVKGWIHVFVARRAGSSAFVEIGGLVVLPDCRRQGIGKRLVEHAMKWSRAEGLRVRVRCNAKRTQTHEFYRAVGFTDSKTQLVFDTDA